MVVGLKVFYGWLVCLLGVELVCSLVAGGCSYRSCVAVVSTSSIVLLLAHGDEAGLASMSVG